MARARRRLAGMVLAAALGASPANAAGRLDWFALEILPHPIRAELSATRQLACGALPRSSLPVGVPGDARLVFVSCHGGPYACTGRTEADVGFAWALTCPPDPETRQIATVHLVSRLPVDTLRSHYRRILDQRFAALDDEHTGDVTFIEKPAPAAVSDWWPKRLHLALWAARGPFLGAGFRSQIRITLSVTPPSEPRPSLRCRRRGLLDPPADASTPCN